LKGGDNMDQLDMKLMKLFILADGIENLTTQYDYDDLLYSLLDTIKDIQPIYEEHREQLLSLA
jgi:hypothetical protein